LFKYIPNSGYTPNILTNYDEDLYFAKQVIVNACATQAILAILLNNEDKIELGQELLELKNFTKLMDPYMKGLSISNCDKIREEHNKFSRPEPFVFTGKKEAGDKDDVFHFVAYFQFKNSVYEIDGLREGPILIAENVENQSWIKAVQPSILSRINLYANNEIKFNLLAMIPDKKSKIESTLEDLENRKDYLLNLVKSTEENNMVFLFI
jgi:ubiquitin carboxyl-terminal hydrolase L5